MNESHTTGTVNKVSKATDTPLDGFLAANGGKPVVAVQGLGFVGAVMSLVISDAIAGDYAVIGVDLPSQQDRIDAINSGTFPIVAEDPKILELYERSRAKGNFLASSNPKAFAHADVVIVDINLDVQKKVGEEGMLEDFDVDTTPFTKAMETIGAHCKADVLILVETTVPVGTCKHIVQPTIHRCLEERGLPTNEIRIGHSYERVMPGPQYVDSIQNFFRVYSGIDEKSADAAEKFLRTIIRTDEYPLTRLGNTNATEMAKVLENSYRAMNIAFMVEWTRFAEEASVDLYEVVKAIRMRPTHKNIMLPGIGVGGYCLTKDPLLASWSRQTLIGGAGPLTQSEQGVKINDRMPYYAFKFLKNTYGKDLAGKRVLLLGVSYRQDVGDTRYTPVELLYDMLEGEGCEIGMHDPYVPYWEEKDITVPAEIEPLLEQRWDIAVISTGHSVYRDNQSIIDGLAAKGQCLLYDTIGIYSADFVDALPDEIQFKVLGRGDI